MDDELHLTSHQNTVNVAFSVLLRLFWGFKCWQVDLFPVKFSTNFSCNFWEGLHKTQFLPVIKWYVTYHCHVTCQKILWWTLPNKWYQFGHHKIQFVKKGLNDWLQFSEKDISSVQSLSRVQLFTTPWTAAHQASLSITDSRSMLTLMSIESVMPSKHLILCHPLLLPLSIFPSIRVFSNESALRIRWPKFWSFSTSPSKECSGLISFRMDWFNLLVIQRTLQSLLQHHLEKFSAVCCDPHSQRLWHSQ